MTPENKGVNCENWVKTFSKASNSDPEIEAHGKHFTCSYLLDMEQHQFVVEVHKGKVVDITVDPGPLDVRYQFAIRASAETWGEFGKPVPKPMYHGIWSATFRRDMKIEGDVLVLMQNLRCFTRQVILLRTTGTPV
ncbi:MULTISPECIES: hypothetical protein [Halomonadaceae]|uniref:hypothetical protein n=1 Tax=Halomonadaceae TaxID=28256 RepID=UPI000B3FEE26|nr:MULTISPECIES: hypothetical protein [Halomonadaceae]HBN61147.1 hypothetical protein [Halomonas sp.]|tara:strand:+ start:274 stop:681 length:408 start_codon:yes stop_codon:yes gene_type:complete